MGDTAYINSSGSDKEVYAAKVCYDLSFGGYDDWYLLTSNELTRIFSKLYNQSLGNISGTEFYWSSREYSNTTANYQKADPYQSDSAVRNCYYSVRPIRRF